MTPFLNNENEMNKTKIAWTERTWNPVTGCTKYSAGCAHCYAEKMAKRLQGMGLERYKNGFEVTLHPDALNDPKKVKEPSMFFVCSMADLFHEDVPRDFQIKVIDTIEANNHHVFQLLTKRARNMASFFGGFGVRKLGNVWCGVTVENDSVKDRIHWLRQINAAAVRFLSCEPLLSDLGELDLTGIDWVIVGGESGSKRPMKKEWVLNIKRQCEEQGVPFFFKQWGTYGEDGERRSKEANGCTIDGVTYQAYPKALAERV